MSLKVVNGFSPKTTSKLPLLESQQLMMVGQNENFSLVSIIPFKKLMALIDTHAVKRIELGHLTHCPNSPPMSL